jgi:hypothetical protein
LGHFTNDQNTKVLERLLKNLVDWVNLYNSHYAKTFDPISGFTTAALGGGLITPLLNSSLVDLFGEEGQLAKKMPTVQLVPLTKDCEVLAKTSQSELEKQATEVQNELLTAIANIQVMIGNEKSTELRLSLEETERHLKKAKSDVDDAMEMYRDLGSKMRTKFMEPGASLDSMFANLLKFFQRLQNAHAKWLKRSKDIASLKPKQVKITSIKSEVDERNMVDKIRQFMLPELEGKA